MGHRNLVSERINDDFSTFDGDEWILKGDATYRSDTGRVRLTPASDSTEGALKWRGEMSKDVWETTFQFDIEDGSADPADETTFAFYTAGIQNGWEAEGGYQVSYDHYDDEIRLSSYVDGEQEVLDFSPVTVPDTNDTNFARIKYTRGRVVVSMNGDRYIEHHIDDPQKQDTGVFFSARTGGENAAHYVDNIRITVATDRNIKTVQDDWPTPAIDIGNQSNTYKLMRALVSVLDEQDKELDSIRRAHHIDTATDEELERFGDLVQLDRKSGESDKKYRARLKVQYRVGNIGTTFDQFAQFSATLLSTDIDNIEFVSDLAADPATAVVAANPGVYDQVALTANEIVKFLGEAVPAGHEVKVLERGTFRLKEDGQADDPDKGLTSDSISTGGTLAADIV